MNFIIRLVCGLVALSLLLIPLLLLSWWLTIFALLGTGYLIWGRYSRRPWAGWLFGILTVILLIVLNQKSVLPSHSRTTSCDSSLTARVTKAFRGTPADGTIGVGAPTELEIRQLMLQRDASRFLYRARRAVDVDVMLNSIGRVLELQSAPGLEAPRKEVNDGSAAIRQFLNEKNLTNKESRKDSYQEFEAEINPLVERAKQAADVQTLREIEGKMFAVDNRSLLAGLGERMFSLQESLLALTRQAVDTKPTYYISWDDTHGLATYREEITVTSRQDAFLAEVDASLLKREAESSNSQYAISIRNGEGAAQPVQDSEHILIEPKAKQITIVFDRSAKPEIMPYCNCGPLATIERLLFVWPTSGDSIRLGATLASGDLRLPTWFSLNRSLADFQVVKEIELPEYSYFASRQPLQVTTQDEHDVLTSNAPNLLSIRSFAADQENEKANWIEVMQKHRILRNYLVNKYREYLVIENGIAAIFALGLGALVSAVFPKIEFGAKKE